MFWANYSKRFDLNNWKTHNSKQINRERRRTFAEHDGSAGALNWHWTDRGDSGARTDSLTDTDGALSLEAPSAV